MHLLFDLDGTLTDSRLGIITSIQHSLATQKLTTPPAEELLWCIGPPILESFKKLVGAESPHLFEATVQSYRDRYSTIGLFENEVYPGIQEALVELRSQGHVLHVATSKAVIYARRIIEHFGLSPYFSSVHGSELDGTRANKAQLIAYILEVEKIQSSEALMIGDREHDMIGAKANGIPGIGVLWGYGSHEEQKSSGAITSVSHPSQLTTIVTSFPNIHQEIQVRVAG
jgi:phosphoglycolate phosphatase